MKKKDLIFSIVFTPFLLTALCFLLSSAALAGESTNADQQRPEDYSTDYDYIMSLDGPSSMVSLGGALYRDNDGDLKGTLATRGVSAISCVLSGNAGGIENLYYIYIRWNGDEAVQSISASDLKITNTSVLNPVTYHSGGFSISGLSGTSGYRSIGTCYIPKSVNKVRIKSTGLKAYFYNADFWLKLNEINGIYNLP